MCFRIGSHLTVGLKRDVYGISTLCTCTWLRLLTCVPQHIFLSIPDMLKKEQNTTIFFTLNNYTRVSNVTQATLEKEEGLLISLGGYEGREERYLACHSSVSDSNDVIAKFRLRQSLFCIDLFDDEIKIPQMWRHLLSPFFSPPPPPPPDNLTTGKNEGEGEVDIGLWNRPGISITRTGPSWSSGSPLVVAWNKR